jgi:hypothetical protein
MITFLLIKQELLQYLKLIKINKNLKVYTALIYILFRKFQNISENKTFLINFLRTRAYSTHLKSSIDSISTRKIYKGSSNKDVGDTPYCITLAGS